MAKSIVWEPARPAREAAKYLPRIDESSGGRSVYETAVRSGHEAIPIVRLAHPDFGILRRAFGLFLMIVPTGLMMMSLSVGTSVAQLFAGIGVALLWLGCLVIVVAAYVCGLRTGYFLLSPRSSITAMIIFSGLALTAVIAGIEFTL